MTLRLPSLGGLTVTATPAEQPGRAIMATWLDAIEEGMHAGALLATRRERALAIYRAIRPLIGHLLEGPQS